jgi:hypothetical protein
MIVDDGGFMKLRCGVCNKRTADKDKKEYVLLEIGKLKKQLIKINHNIDPINFVTFKNAMEEELVAIDNAIYIIKYPTYIEEK